MSWKIELPAYLGIMKNKFVKLQRTGTVMRDFLVLGSLQRNP